MPPRGSSDHFEEPGGRLHATSHRKARARTDACLLSGCRGVGRGAAMSSRHTKCGPRDILSRSPGSGDVSERIGACSVDASLPEVGQRVLQHVDRRAHGAGPLPHRKTIGHRMLGQPSLHALHGDLRLRANGRVVFAHGEPVGSRSLEPGSRFGKAALRRVDSAAPELKRRLPRRAGQEEPVVVRPRHIGTTHGIVDAGLERTRGGALRREARLAPAQRPLTTTFQEPGSRGTTHLMAFEPQVSSTHRRYGDDRNRRHSRTGYLDLSSGIIAAAFSSNHARGYAAQPASLRQRASSSSASPQASGSPTFAACSNRAPIDVNSGKPKLPPDPLKRCPSRAICS